VNNTARIGFDSVTYAMQAKDLLARHSVISYAVRLRASESGTGCAFGLELSRRDLTVAVTLLSKAQMKYSVIG